MRIFIVDDDPVQRLIAGDATDAERDEIREFASGDAFLASRETPDLILLDIEMPGIDGIEACRRFRAGGDERVPVIFISAHDDLETRLTAYAAGGSDFVVKPFASEELGLKIEAARKAAEQQNTLLYRQEMAQQVAFTAMSSMGEQGIVIQFMQESFACTSPEALARALLHACAQYGLSGVLEFRCLDELSCFGSDGPSTPLERSILAHARKLDRVFRFSSQLSVTYPHATLVVKNLPADEALVGRLRDHLALLVQAAEARISALAGDLLCQRQSRAILNSTGELTGVLAHIDAHQEENGLRLIALACDYTTELSRAFVHLGLSEKQEVELGQLAQVIGEKLSQFIDENRKASEQLRTVVGRLRQLGSSH